MHPLAEFVRNALSSSFCPNIARQTEALIGCVSIAYVLFFFDALLDVRTELSWRHTIRYRLPFLAFGHFLAAYQAWHQNDRNHWQDNDRLHLLQELDVVRLDLSRFSAEQSWVDDERMSDWCFLRWSSSSSFYPLLLCIILTKKAINILVVPMVVVL